MKNPSVRKIAWYDLQKAEITSIFGVTFPGVRVYPSESIVDDLSQLGKATLELLEDRSESTVYRIKDTGKVYQVQNSKYTGYNDVCISYGSYKAYQAAVSVDNLTRKYDFHEEPAYTIHQAVEGDVYVLRNRKPRFKAWYHSSAQDSSFTIEPIDQVSAEILPSYLRTMKRTFNGAFRLKFICLMLLFLLFSCTKDTTDPVQGEINPDISLSGLTLISPSVNKAYVDMPVTVSIALRNTAERMSVQVEYLSYLKHEGSMTLEGKGEIPSPHKFEYTTAVTNDQIRFSFIPKEVEAYNLRFTISAPGFPAKTLTVNFEAITPIFSVEYRGLPAVLEVERPYDFTMIIRELYTPTSHDVHVKASASFTQGGGMILLDGEEVPSTTKASDLCDMSLGENALSIYSTVPGKNTVLFQLVNEYEQQQLWPLEVNSTLPTFEFTARALAETAFVGQNFPIEITIQSDHPTNTFTIAYNTSPVTDEAAAAGYASQADERFQDVATKSSINESLTKTDILYIPVQQVGQQLATITVTDKFNTKRQQTVSMKTLQMKMSVTTQPSSPFTCGVGQSTPFTLNVSAEQKTEFVLTYTIPTGSGLVQKDGVTLQPNTHIRIGTSTALSFTPTAAGLSIIKAVVSLYENQALIATHPIDLIFQTGKSPITAELSDIPAEISIQDNLTFSLTASEPGYTKEFTVYVDTHTPVKGTLTSAGKTIPLGTNFTLTPNQPMSFSYAPATAGNNDLYFNIMDGNQPAQEVMKTLNFTVKDLDAALVASTYDYNITTTSPASFTLRMHKPNHLGDVSMSFSQPVGTTGTVSYDGAVITPGSTFSIAPNRDISFGFIPKSFGNNTLTFSCIVGGQNLTKELKFNCLVGVTLVSSSTSQGTVYGGGNYDYGSNQTMIATPKAGYKFLGWYNGANQVSTDERYQINLTGDLILTAKFGPQQYTLDLTANSTRGSVSGGGTLNFGATASIRATPKTGFIFAGWSDGLGGALIEDNPYSFKMPAQDLFYEATFSSDQLTITATAADGGRVSGGGLYNYGDLCTLRATSNPGNKFDGWYLGSNRVSTNATYSFSVTTSRSYEARFTKEKYTLTLLTTNGGSASGGGTFAFGSSVSVTATPNSKYRHDGWYDLDGNLLTKSSVYTLTMPASSLSIEARFSMGQIAVTTVAGEGGSITGGGNYAYNALCTLTATALEHYSFAGWYQGETRISGSNPYAFTVTDDIMLTGRFDRILIGIHAIAETDVAMNGGSVSGTASYPWNTPANLVATPNEGFSFDGWYDGDKRVATTLTFTPLVTEVKAYIAKFTVNYYDVTVSTNTPNAGVAWIAESSSGGVGQVNTCIYGSEFVLKATPHLGWYFYQWLLPDGSTYTSETGGDGYKRTVGLENNYTAVFKKVFISINTTHITYECDIEDNNAVHYGESFTITCIPKPGYRFVGWFREHVKEPISTANPYTFTLTEAFELEARCEAIK